MYRQEIHWSVPPVEIRLRTAADRSNAAPGRGSSGPQPVSFPQATVPHTATAAPPPDLRPALESIAHVLRTIDERRQQSLAELQQVALELAVAVASHLVFETISQDQHSVQQLVRQAVESLGLQASPTVSLHPQDFALLQKQFQVEPPTWNDQQVTLRADSSVARGGCRVETPDGRMQVSDISTRLSEIRRHWMEELDDSQIERRRSGADGSALRRFPDRREIA